MMTAARMKMGATRIFFIGLALFEIDELPQLGLAIADGLYKPDGITYSLF
jgi:hypothetical protein